MVALIAGVVTDSADWLMQSRGRMISFQFRASLERLIVRSHLLPSKILSPSVLLIAVEFL